MGSRKLINYANIKASSNHIKGNSSGAQHPPTPFGGNTKCTYKLPYNGHVHSYMYIYVCIYQHTCTTSIYTCTHIRTLLTLKAFSSPFIFFFGTQTLACTMHPLPRTTTPTGRAVVDRRTSGTCLLLLERRGQIQHFSSGNFSIACLCTEYVCVRTYIAVNSRTSE